MSELDSIVNVTIQAGTSTAAQTGFGVPLTLAYHARFADLSRVYSSPQEMLDDGFSTDDQAYLQAAAIFRQSPRPPRVRVGRLPAPSTPHTTELDVGTIASGESVSVTTRTAAGVVTTTTQAYATSPTGTATALAAALNALAGIDATSSGTVVTVEASTNGPMVFFSDLTGPIYISDVTADWGYDDALSDILDETEDFYAVSIDVNSPANVLAAAAWVLADGGRIAAFAPQYNDPTDFDATAATLVTNDRAFFVIKKDARSNFFEAADLGEGLPFVPGSQTWAFKTPKGQVPDAWTTSQKLAIEAQNSNHYMLVAGKPVTRWGTMASGQFIDVTRGLDWLVARIQEAVVTLQFNNRKIPYTNSGIELVKSAIAGVLAQGVTNGVLEGGLDPVTGEDVSPKVNSIPVLSIPQADRALRRLTGITFSGRLAGAVHSADIRGTVTV